VGVHSLEGSGGAASRGLVAARVVAANVIQKRAGDFGLIGLAIHRGDHGRLSKAGAETVGGKAHLVLEGVRGRGSFAIFTIEDLFAPIGVGKFGSTRLNRSGVVSLVSSNRPIEGGASIGLGVVDHLRYARDELELLELLGFGNQMEGASLDEVPNTLYILTRASIVGASVSVGAVRSLVGPSATVRVEFDVSHV